MRFVNSNKDKALLEMATLRYINNELVGLGEKDHLIKITINKDEYEDPHFNIVIGTTIIRIDLDTLSGSNPDKCLLLDIAIPISKSTFILFQKSFAILYIFLLELLLRHHL